MIRSKDQVIRDQKAQIASLMMSNKQKYESKNSIYDSIDESSDSEGNSSDSQYSRVPKFKINPVSKCVDKENMAPLPILAPPPPVLRKRRSPIIAQVPPIRGQCSPPNSELDEGFLSGSGSCASSTSGKDQVNNTYEFIEPPQLKTCQQFMAENNLIISPMTMANHRDVNRPRNVKRQMSRGLCIRVSNLDDIEEHQVFQDQHKRSQRIVHRIKPVFVWNWNHYFL